MYSVCRPRNNARSKLPSRSMHDDHRDRFFSIVLGSGILTIPDFKRIICIRAEHKWVPTTKAIYGEHLHASVICDLVPFQGIPSFPFPAMIRATNPSIASPEHTFIENASTARSGPRFFCLHILRHGVHRVLFGYLPGLVLRIKADVVTSCLESRLAASATSSATSQAAARVSDESGQSMGH